MHSFSRPDEHRRPITIAKFVAISAGCVTLMTLSACTTARLKLGTRIRIERAPIASIEASLPKGPAISPGQRLALVVQFRQPDGKILATEGQGKGKVLWQDLTVTASVVTADQKGSIRLPDDPRISDGKTAHISITVPTHPDVRAELDVPITYNYNFVASFSGSPGSDGLSGTDGVSGTPGSIGSIDPSNPSPGGDGGNGTDGSNGQDGSAGGNAPNVQVFVALRSGTHPLLQVSVSAAGETRLYLVDPQGGALTVNADGGRGGHGGRGGRGGRGGSGGSGTPNGNNGRDGADGRNGFDGSPGKGGSIRVAYDPQAKPFLTILHFSNSGGPTPSFDEQAVAPLW